MPYAVKCVLYILSKDRIDIRMPSNDEFTVVFKLNQNTTSDRGITCAEATNGIICQDANIHRTFNFAVIINNLLSISIPETNTQKRLNIW